MKRTMWLITMMLAAAIAVVGCGKKEGVDTAKVESSFATAEPATKSDVDKAVDSAKAGKYAEALASLQKVAAKAKLTPDQQQAINDLISQVQQQLTASANKAAGDAQKAVGDLQKSLPGTK